MLFDLNLQIFSFCFNEKSPEAVEEVFFFFCCANTSNETILHVISTSCLSPRF